MTKDDYHRQPERQIGLDVGTAFRVTETDQSARNNRAAILRATSHYLYHHTNAGHISESVLSKFMNNNNKS